MVDNSYVLLKIKVIIILSIIIKLIIGLELIEWESFIQLINVNMEGSDGPNGYGPNGNPDSGGVEW